MTILAVLSGILLPVFMRAKHSGLKSADIQRIRQLGIACTLYAGDYDDRFPLVVDPVSLIQYGQGEVLFGDERDEVLKTLPLLPAALSSYVRNESMFCSYLPSRPILNEPGGPTKCEVYGVSYRYDDLRAFVDGRFESSDPMLVSPEILMRDAADDLLDVWFVNCAYGDSHVRFINRRECISAFLIP